MLHPKDLSSDEQLPADCSVVRSGRGTQQPPLRNPPTWRRLDAAGETTNTAGTATNREKQSTHKFNEVWQRAYVLGTREREILLIHQSIQLIQEGNLREFLRILLGIQYMRALASLL